MLSTGERTRTVLSARPPAPVVVVDDDPTIRSFIAELLRDESVPVLAASNGQSALELIGDRQVSLIFLDMQMPIMDGWAFVEVYRSRPGPKAPIVCMTAASEAVAWGADIRAVAVLRKPFHLDQVLALVDRFVPAGSG